MRFFFGSLLLSSLVLATGVASAQGPAAPPDRVTAPATEEPTHKPFTINVNPLSYTIGRYGVDFQYLPIAHHAIVLNPFFARTKAEVTSNFNGQVSKYEQAFSGFGGELGYRFYSSEKGASGFFVGPSLIAGTYTASSTGSEKVSFSSLGYAVDIGGQAILRNGITIGGGFGLQYTKVNKDFSDLPLTAAILAGGGFRPRFLLAFGYSFG